VYDNLIFARRTDTRGTVIAHFQKEGYTMPEKAAQQKIHFTEKGGDYRLYIRNRIVHDGVHLGYDLAGFELSSLAGSRDESIAGFDIRPGPDSAKAAGGVVYSRPIGETGFYLQGRLDQRVLQREKAAIARNVLLLSLVLIAAVLAVSYFTILRLTLGHIRERDNVNARLNATIRERETLLKELHHRVKNNLNLISSYLNLQALETDNPELEERNEALSSRINAISLVHEKLQSSDTFLYFEIGPYLEDLCNKIIAGSSLQEATFSADIRAAVEVSSKQAIYLGLIIAEFTLNSLKHAAADEELQIDLKVNRRDGQLILSYYDNGEPFPEDFDLSERSSLGLMVVGRLVAQLDGRLDYDFSISKEIRIIVPLEEAEAAASS
jgi:two-component sensor histidine kinase